MESPVAKRPRGRPPKARAVPIEFRPTPPASVEEGEVVAYLDLQDGGLKVKLTKNGTLYTGLLPLVLEAETK